MSRGKNNQSKQTPTRAKQHDHSIYLDYPYLEAAAKNFKLPANPKKVLVAGDAHGSLMQIAYLIEMADRFDCDVILQVGDFGYMPHVQPNYIKQADKWLKEDGKTIIAIDGNHENFAALNAPHPQHQQFQVLGQQILYAPRGTSWVWQGKTILALGGAHSIDKKTRLFDESIRTEDHQKSRWRWWEEELLTDRDIAKAKAVGHADIIIAHDCPQSVLLDHRVLWKKAEAETQENRTKLQDVIDTVKPKLVFHGHYHQRYTDIGGHEDHAFEVQGLGRDGMGEASFTVLDLTQDLPNVKPRFTFDS
jgi:Icc-related predicted phosphoesterase